MTKLAIHIAEQVGLVPMLKAHEFTLLSADDQQIDTNKIVDAIGDFLKLMSIEKDFTIIPKGNKVTILSLKGEDLKPLDGDGEPFFVCQHCGHVTKYESIHKNHEKLHYIAFG